MELESNPNLFHHTTGERLTEKITVQIYVYLVPFGWKSKFMNRIQPKANLKRHCRSKLSLTAQQ
ncbi:hypothetical protein M5W75_14195 [Paenibacillus larvae]|uniref:hypothetical protein n=1 Tax=Paenibacillus larvae TaxID=1464 RepID=UPI00228005D4|nr:hypothetical protein [Paenibacillus larvae]MCY9750969.1 hypothetical protein [Paenibacillus larvae]